MNRMGFVLFAVLGTWAGGVRADCSGGAEATGLPCDLVSWEGCCEGSTLLFCEAGEICRRPCEANPSCGYSADKGFYDCGTDGMPDPSGANPMECPQADSCKGVTYSGCCAGSTVVWCEGGSLRTLDCSSNGTLVKCSQAESGAANCGPESASAGPICPFADSDVVSGDLVVGDVVSGDSTVEADLSVNMDAVYVPDIAAPAQCADLAEAYDVGDTDCPGFGSVGLVKQEGCVAVFVGLAGEAEAYPAGKVTLSGVAFDFLQGGQKRSCAAQIVGEVVEGQCFWGGSQCMFRMTPRVETGGNGDPGNGGSGGGGCSSNGQTDFGFAAVLAVLLVVSAIALMRRYGRATGDR